MDEWDVMLNFQTQLHDEAKLTVDGFKAINYIYTLARRLNLNFPISPYMKSRFNSNSAYNWLIRFAKILAIIQAYSNSEDKIKRVFSPDFEGSISAIYEIEIALRLHLNDIVIEFPKELSSRASPDIVAMIDSNRYNIEVTTINYPESIKWTNYLHHEIQRLGFEYKMVIGGQIVTPRSIDQVEDFLNKVEEVFKKEKSAHSISSISEDGLAKIKFASNHASVRPDRSFTFVNKTPHDTTDKIIYKLRKKNKQLKFEQNSGILCIFNGTEATDPVHLFEEEFDKIDVALGTYPNINGLFVGNYRIFYPDNKRSIPVKRKENRTLFQVKPALEPQETTIMWDNIESEKKFPKAIEEAFMHYSENIKKLDSYPIP